MTTSEQLLELQSKSLKEKIQISSARIMEWYQRWNGQMYVSFSGGKDSVVLLHLVRRLYPEVVGVYIDTGLEYPELREFVKTFEDITWLYPQKYDRHTITYKRYTFAEILKDCGYPIVSKEQAAFISEYRTTKSEKLKAIRFKGKKYLILGNHDRINAEMAKHFVWCYRRLEVIKDEEQKIVLCHYPIAYWEGQDHTPQTIHLYGHIHQGRDLRPFERYVKLWEKATGMVFKAANVGCMMPYMDYTPRTLEEIKKAKGWG